MSKYRLRTQHVIGGAIRNPGTVVGDDSDCAVPYYGDPSPDMEGLDKASIDRVNEVHQRLYGRVAPWNDPRAAVAEEPALAQDRVHAAMKPEDREKAEAKSAELMDKANAAGGTGTAPATSLPVAAPTTEIVPASEDSQAHASDKGA